MKDTYWIEKATADILRAGYSDGSEREIFANGVKIICALPALGLRPVAVGYLATNDPDRLKLAFQHGLDWPGLDQIISPPNEVVERLSIDGNDNLTAFQFPIMTAEGSTTGALRLFPVGLKSLDDESVSAIRRLLSDLATVVEKRRVDSINSHLAELAGVSPNEMYLIDADTLKIFQANRSAQINTGYRPDQILGKHPATFKEGLPQEDYEKQIRPLLSGEKNHIEFEGLQKKRDGTAYQASFKVWKLDSDDGTVLVEVVVDDSGHKQVLSLLQATFNSFPGGICVLDGNLDLLIANQRLYELIDISKDQFPVGCNYENIIRFNAERGDYGPGNTEEQVSERVNHAKLFIEHSFERTRPDGTILEVRSSPLPGGGSVVTYVDVTARRRVELEIRRHRDMLETAVQMRTAELEEKSLQLEEALEHERQINLLQRQFVSMASHEFRTPLAVIDGAAQRLARKAERFDPKFVLEKTAQVRSGVERIIELMESILSAGRLENGAIAINLVECPISEVVADCCKKRQELARDHNITLRLDGLPETIVADRLAMDQVFTNLLSNAVKYSPGSPEIVVSGWVEGDLVKFSVADQGLGMDEDDIPRMFERYFRARTSTGIAGTGIGLNLIKQIIELHDGAIEVHSKKGKGSVFTVTLPVAGPTNDALPADQDAA